VHGRLDGRREPARDLVEVEEARHGAGQRLDGPRVVVALAEEGAIDRAPHPFAERVEQEDDAEHERPREPRRARPVRLGHERIGPGEQQRVRAGDEAGQHRVDHRAADHDGGVEEPVAHGGVPDGERIEQHEHRPHLRVHRAVVVVNERREHEGQPAPEPEADAEHENRGLLVHERRAGAAARVDERPDLDGEGHRGDGELKANRRRIEPAVDEEPGRGRVHGHEDQR
jgi:hypothetical protein